MQCLVRFTCHADISNSAFKKLDMLGQFLQANSLGNLYLVYPVLVSGWQSVTGVFMNIGSGVNFIKQAKLYMYMQKSLRGSNFFPFKVNPTLEGFRHSEQETRNTKIKSL